MSGLKDEIEQLRHSIGHDDAGPAHSLWHENTKEEWLLKAPRDFAGQRALMIRAIHERLQGVAELVSPEAIERALMAMSVVPREQFVCPWVADLAYLPMAIDIGLEQTISHPELVAIMVAGADPDGGHVLDAGTGSGYQAAVLARVAEHVTSIEIIEPHARKASQRIREGGYDNITVLQGDASELAAMFPQNHFDAIVVAAKADKPPTNLVKVLKAGGRLIMPIENADRGQNLVVFRKTDDNRLEETILCPAQFVPLTGICGNAAPLRIPAN